MHTLTTAPAEQWGALLEMLGTGMTVRPVSGGAADDAPCTVSSLLGMMDAQALELPMSRAPTAVPMREAGAAAREATQAQKGGLPGRPRARRAQQTLPLAPTHIEEDKRDLDELLRELGEEAPPTAKKVKLKPKAMPKRGLKELEAVVSENVPVAAPSPQEPHGLASLCRAVHAAPGAPEGAAAEAAVEAGDERTGAPPKAAPCGKTLEAGSGGRSGTAAEERPTTAAAGGVASSSSGSGGEAEEAQEEDEWQTVASRAVRRAMKGTISAPDPEACMSKPSTPASIGRHREASEGCSTDVAGSGEGLACTIGASSSSSSAQDPRAGISLSPPTIGAEALESQAGIDRVDARDTLELPLASLVAGTEPHIVEVAQFTDPRAGVEVPPVMDDASPLPRCLRRAKSEGELPGVVQGFASPAADEFTPTSFTTRPSVGTWLGQLSPLAGSRNQGKEERPRTAVPSDFAEDRHAADIGAWHQRPSVGSWLQPPLLGVPDAQDHAQLWGATPESTPPASPRGAEICHAPGSPQQVVWVPVPVHLLGEVQQVLYRATAAAPTHPQPAPAVQAVWMVMPP